MPTLTGKTIEQLTQITGLTSDTFFPVSYSGITYKAPYSAITNYYEVTYDELYSLYTGSSLNPGGYYLITDYQTCYDQPDFDYNSNPITGTSTYHTSSIEPLLVLATRIDTISDKAYQPAYPKDKITYDIDWNQTEVTSSPAKGRITERIDEFNNRTDYDHRAVLFKRYRLFTNRYGLIQNGSIELQSDGTVLGTNTNFTGLSVGDVIYMDGNGLYFEITGITDSTTMQVSGDTITPFGCCYSFYKTVEETNGTEGYFSVRRTNVKTNDFAEYTTFGNALDISYAKNNYVGNYANNYQNVASSTFLLSNNVFLEGEYESNKFGDYCYNNTFGTDNQNNVWGDYCYENVSTNDMDFNTIGHYFYRNLLNVNFTNNQIGNHFNSNELLAENNEDFEYNIIGNNFAGNTVYSWFYKNEILDGFIDNIIGDYGNLTNFEFYRNYIRNGFVENTIRQNFDNNQVGTNFQNNTINGLFQGNTILNGFNGNKTGENFALNNIGNAFNQNTVNDYFYRNTTNYYFHSNRISNNFFSNTVGEYFENNKPSNLNLFSWFDLSTVSSRNYGLFYNVVGGGGIGNKILGKELIMKVDSTSQYFKVKFTQWTQGANGGGFQYERQEIDSAGSILGPTIKFTKTNYGSEVDIVVPGVLEITRGNQNGIYNKVSEVSWNSSVSPSGSSWNSIYSENENGNNFAYNIIGTNFYSNVIGNGFGFGWSTSQGNKIGNYFWSNTIGEYFYNNVIADGFYQNTITDYFQLNDIKFSLNNTNFTSATHVYGDYNCTLFKNSASASRLSYYDGSDVLNITNITA